jgi:hypothetical protein
VSLSNHDCGSCPLSGTSHRAQAQPLEAGPERAGGLGERRLPARQRWGAERSPSKKMCARKELKLRVPEDVRALFSACCRVTRAGASRTLVLVAAHFIETWKVKERRTTAKRVIERNGGWCAVPGCSRPAVHAHHIQFRSHGGGPEDENQVGVCLAHHLHGIHKGYVRVRGKAPDALVWELGEV